MKFFLIVLISIIFIPLFSASAEDMTERLSGRILLQVQSRGEAWYVSPRSLKRYYLGRPKDAFDIMREEGIGISNADLIKIPVGLNFSDSLGEDNDKLEITLYNPNDNGVFPIDINFSEKQKGKIFLQVEGRGEAWYVNPVDYKRYFLGRPSDAFNIMKFFGLGITNEDLEKITNTEDIEGNTTSVRSDIPYYNLAEIEKKVFESVNKRREDSNLKLLKWNDELAEVARKHSDNLAKENKNTTSIDKYESKACQYPIIHHGGFDSGINVGDRLKNKGINNFNVNGENGLILPVLSTKNYEPVSPDITSDMMKIELNRCKEFYSWEEEFRKNLKNTDDEEKKFDIIESEIEKRKNAHNNSISIILKNDTWLNDDQISENMVDNWMDSFQHKNNILFENYNEAGIGISYINGYMIAFQVFIEKNK